jgi:hypothetical protein
MSEPENPPRLFFSHTRKGNANVKALKAWPEALGLGRGPSSGKLRRAIPDIAMKVG